MVSSTIWPEEMPETQLVPVLSAAAKIKSRGSIANDAPPNESATLVVVSHGMTKPPWPSDCAPGIAAWTAAASAGGATMSVVPVSRIAERPVSPRSCPSAVTASIAPSQKPAVAPLVATLSNVTSVAGSNLVVSSAPNVISPSFLLSARREILYEVIASSIRPADASDSTGVGTPWFERVCTSRIETDSSSKQVRYDIPTGRGP